jgi:16S rRNA (uracil1498-N3)-methyltransferase
MSQQSSHQFALFVPNLSKIIGTHFAITDGDIITRVTAVLRLRANDRCTLFDAGINADITITAVHKKEMLCTLIEQKKNIILKPHITVFLPVLKRDDLESAVTMLAACGVSALQLLYTEKTHRIWTEKDAPRLERLIIAAAEQSKHFALSKLYPPIEFNDCIAKKSADSTYIFFDPDGSSLTETVQQIQKKSVAKLTLIVGPEGDLTNNEKKLLRDHGILFCSLTPTVLRASLAATLGLGAFRSLLK